MRLKSSEWERMGRHGKLLSRLNLAIVAHLEIQKSIL